MEGVLAGMVVWEQPCSLVWWMTLTEAGLWPYRGEIEGKKGGEGKADEVCLHTEVCCPLCSLQHMAKALELTKKKKKKKKTSTEKTGWKSTSHSVWKQVSQTECASRHL